MSRTVWLFEIDSLEATHGPFYGREIITSIFNQKSVSPIFDIWTGDLNSLFFGVASAPHADPRDVAALTAAFQPLVGFRATTEIDLNPNYLVHTFVLTPNGCREADEFDLGRILALFHKHSSRAKKAATLAHHSH